MNELQNFGKITALASFVAGSTIFALYSYFGEPDFPIQIGILFVIGALVINTGIVLVLIGAALLKSENRIELLKTCGIMLLNIPVVILYFYLLFII